MKVVTAILNPQQLRRALRQLDAEGYKGDQISVISSPEHMPEFLEGEPEMHAVEGAAAGAVTGGLLGALGAWVAPAVPGFEAMLATGALTTAAGSAIGGYLGSLYSVRAESQTKLDVHEDLEAGSMLLVVHTKEGGASRAASILTELEGKDVEIHDLPDEDHIAAEDSAVQ
ncbi:MAG: hypothetical protein ACK2UK_20575 [Candidatus Promineifilaceae bacterium]